MGNMRTNVAFAHGTLAVADTALALSAAATITAEDLEAADAAIITVEDAAIRYWLDGTDPTASAGHLVDVGDDLHVLSAENLQNLRVIRDGDSGTATLMISLLQLK